MKDETQEIVYEELVNISAAWREFFIDELPVEWEVKAIPASRIDFMSSEELLIVLMTAKPERAMQARFHLRRRLVEMHADWVASRIEEEKHL